MVAKFDGAFLSFDRLFREVDGLERRGEGLGLVCSSIQKQKFIEAWVVADVKQLFDHLMRE